MRKTRRIAPASRLVSPTCRKLLMILVSLVARGDGPPHPPKVRTQPLATAHLVAYPVPKSQNDDLTNYGLPCTHITGS